MVAYGRALATAMPTYPVEAATALGNSVQADELDDRCGAPGTGELAVPFHIYNSRLGREHAR